MDIAIRLERIQCVEVPERLSVSPVKRALYSIDPFFREGWGHLNQALGDSAIKILDTITCIIFKPDAFAGRRLKVALELLAKWNYIPIAFSPFYYNRNIIREDWRYQYNIATQERIDFVDTLLTSGPSLLVILESRHHNYKNGTASEYLKYLKGPSQPERRTPGQLRYDLGVVSTFINFIHTTDESIDIPRTLSLYFNFEERSELIRSINVCNDVSDDLYKLVHEFYKEYPDHDLNFSNSLSRLTCVLNQAPDVLSPSGNEYLQERLRSICNQSGSEDCQSFFNYLHTLQLKIPLWDELVIRAELVTPNVIGGMAILP